MSANDTQVGGDHYRSKSVQPWDAMQAWVSPEQFKGHLRCCVIQYVARSDDKGGIEDLEKAQHYLAKLIEVMKAEEPLDYAALRVQCPELFRAPAEVQNERADAQPDRVHIGHRPDVKIDLGPLPLPAGQAAAQPFAELDDPFDENLPPTTTGVPL